LTSSFESCFKALYDTDFEADSIQLIFQPQIICNHCDEFGVCGFAAGILDSIAEIAVEGIHISSVPRYLYGVTDSTFHAARGGLVFLENYRTWKLIGIDAISE
jgi:hypothetical protein